MTIQFPQVETSEPRLFTDNYAQRNSDFSFEEKLKFEQARLGLLFSPFARFEALFSSTLNFNFGADKIETGLNAYLLPEQTKPKYSELSQTSNYSRSPDHPTARVFDSLPLQSQSRQFWQNLLLQTGWLVPNLEAQPLFYQSFLEGKLQLKLDLQSLVDQIIEQTKLVKSKGRVELSLTLKPEELGNILLVLTSHAGIVTIQINGNPETRKLIEAQREELERALKKAKVNFDRIKIEEVGKNV